MTAIPIRSQAWPRWPDSFLREFLKVRRQTGNPNGRALHQAVNELAVCSPDMRRGLAPKQGGWLQPSEQERHDTGFGFPVVNSGLARQ